MSAPEIATCLWFDNQGLEAAQVYVSLFDDSEITAVFYKGGDAANSVLTVEFTLRGQRYWILNGGPLFTHSPAASISVHVDTQAEVDRRWGGLLTGGGVESRCGWLVDRFGLSWQIIPRALPRLLKSDSTGRVMAAMMSMVKLDIAALDAAAGGAI